ncbi:MAG TPA: M48 family metalloprotease [Baekduia sp.]|uniref:M48 family metalloprotease n=1 Tax=Baekduia sp. TaxID=2600305 RepID=UPI002D78D4DB|nr:M48 family metalloprotease [Baekduia sp.]HET6506243.1 M48 family metalloprotease [Baekduia sp.]
MVVVSVLTPVVVIAAFAACVALLPVKLLAGLGVITVIGVARAWPRGEGDEAASLARGRRELELQAIVARLCVVGDLEPPEIAVEEERQANSWVIDAPGKRPRLHVTRGLLDLLEPEELEAVVAHELSHVAHRDAAVMTVVGLPVWALLHSNVRGNWGWWPLAVGAILGRGIAFVAGFGSTALSRYRELTADAGAAQLTGHPAALASALRRITGELARLPHEDLRAVAGRDALHVVGVEEPSGLLKLHGHSHPSIEQRVAALERLEHRMAHGRLA